MPLPASLIELLAGRLLTAEASRSAIPPLTDDHPGLTMRDAYAIQERLVAMKVERGSRAIGWKAGLTSRAMRDQMRIAEPNRGVIFAEGFVEDTLQAATLIHPRIEPEIAFVLGGDLTGPGVTAADVLRETEAVCACLEIVDSRFIDYRFRVEDNTADNSSAARLVLGRSRHTVGDLDLSRVGVVLERNGRIELTGTGAATLGHPAEAVAWLVNQLAEGGGAMRAGEIVISGGLTSAPLIHGGDRFVARFDHLGEVGLDVT